MTEAQVFAFVKFNYKRVQSDRIFIESIEVRTITDKLDTKLHLITYPQEESEEELEKDLPQQTKFVNTKYCNYNLFFKNLLYRSSKIYVNSECIREFLKELGFLNLNRVRSYE
jgi:hypothetical protein